MGGEWGSVVGRAFWCPTCGSFCYIVDNFVPWDPNVGRYPVDLNWAEGFFQKLVYPVYQVLCAAGEWVCDCLDDRLVVGKNVYWADTVASDKVF